VDTLVASASTRLAGGIVPERLPVACSGTRKNLVWVRPTLIAEIEYRASTDDGKLRHASYKGLRDVQDNMAAYDISLG